MSLFYDIASKVVRRMRLVFHPTERNFYEYNSDKGIFTQVAPAYVKREIWKDLNDSYSKGADKHAKDILGAAESVNILPRGKSFNPFKGTITLLNGQFNITKLKLFKFSKRFFSTIQIGVRYNPRATCDLWKKTILEIAGGDPALVAVIQEMFGLCLTTLVKFQKAFFLYGEGSNGKSLILNILQALIGMLNVSNIPYNKLSNSHYIAELDNKLVNISTEIDSKGMASTANFKAIVTGDWIQADPKYKDPYNFRPFAKMIFSGNSLPVSNDRSFGFKRRLVIIPLNRIFGEEEAKKELESELMEELDGIFLWALEGLDRLLDKGHFTPCLAVDNAIASYAQDINPLETFLEEVCFRGPSERTEKSEFRSRYTDWCHLNGYKELNAGNLTRELARLKIVAKHSDRVRYYEGVKLLVDDPVGPESGGESGK